MMPTNSHSKRFSTDDLTDAAEHFKKASQKHDKLIEELDGVLEYLNSVWDGAAKQKFYKDYEEWRLYAQGLSALLGQIAEEAGALADRMNANDNLSTRSGGIDVQDRY